jgi:transposase-like protein
MDPEVSDALENAHGTGPQGNVADSLVGALASATPAFAQGGLVGVARKAGLDLPAPVIGMSDLAQSQEFNAAIGVGVPYAPHELEILKTGVEAGKSYAELAKELGRTQKAIEQKVTYMGLSSPNFRAPWSDEKSAKVIELIASGKTYPDISKETGIPETALRKFGSRYELSTKGNQRTQPSALSVNLPEPEAAGDPWLMKQLGYE